MVVPQFYWFLKAENLGIPDQDIEALPAVPPYYLRHWILQYRSTRQNAVADRSCLNNKFLKISAALSVR
jgi:hypothetical protein